MKALWFVVMLGACSSNPLKHDAEMFCAADFSKGLSTIGPTLERDARSDEFKGMLRNLKSGTVLVTDIDVWLQVQVQRTGIEKCPALDQIRRQKAVAPKPAE